jgi:hypothetical protein
VCGNTRFYLNPLTPNDPYRGRTAALTPNRCILYNYSTNIGTEYFKHGIYSQFFPLLNAICFIILTYLVPVLFTFYIQGVLKLKKNNSGAKTLNYPFFFNTFNRHEKYDTDPSTCRRKTAERIGLHFYSTHTPSWHEKRIPRT